MTTTDGTQYFFGKNKGPGWATGDPVTNSAFTEPVYGAHSGDPCFSSGGFSSSSCTQAWRWNLDFVIDPNGNAMAYYYHPETNYYGANGGTTGVQYVRGGYLTRIDYGLRDESGSIYGTANAPHQVVFNADQRCIPTPAFACTASQFTSANAVELAGYAVRPAVPVRGDVQQPRADVLVAVADRQDHHPVLERHHVRARGLLRP